jgi:PAS domain S-box-containing protein
MSLPLPPSAATLVAVLEASGCAQALLDAEGVVRWANAAFATCTGHAAHAALGQRLATLLGSSRTDAEWMARRLSDGAGFTAVQFECASGGGTPMCCEITAVPCSGGFAVTLSDITEARRLARERARLSELLDTAQELGRIGVWERDARTLEGRWDRHMFRFFDLPPGAGTPHFADAVRRVDPTDELEKRFLESLQAPGLYASRYRVPLAGGGVRHLHSQWEVLAGADGLPERAIGIVMDDTEVYRLARSFEDANAQLKMAVELGNIAVWRHDLQTDRMHYNDRAFDVLGIPPRPGGLSIAEVREFVHPDDLPEVLASAERALQTDRPTDMHARYRRADGRWRDVLTRRVVQRGPQGEALAFLGVALDVTEQAEQSRRTLELSRRLEAAAQAARIGLWSTIVRARADGSNSFASAEWNAQMYLLFGLAPPGPPPSFGAWLAQCVHPEDRERVKRRAHEWLVDTQGRVDIEFRVALPPGQPDAVPRWVVLRGNVDHRGSDGMHLFGVAIDVTEQRMALQRLHDAAERAALAARGVGMGTWETDLHRVREYWDEQMFRLRGLEPAERPLNAAEREAMVHPDDLASLRVVADGSMGSGRPASYEFRVVWPDGQVRWLASRSSPLLDAQGVEVRRIGVNWDITDARNADLALREREVALRESQAKSRFLARMSHELRTPLNAVLGFTQLALDDGQGSNPALQREWLQHVLEAGRHLLALIDDVLDISAYEGGELPLALQPVALDALVAQTLPLLRSAADEQGVNIELGWLAASVMADTTRLRQVLLNLLSNAIKYNRRGGLVQIEAREASDAVVLAVVDNGRGMNAEQLRHAFEPFNRLGREDEAIEGTGIGLAIVKVLVERMGGTVHVDSMPGEGSRFELRLRRADGPAPRLPLPPPRAPAHNTLQFAAAEGRPRTLLYIEDNAVNAMIVQELVARRPGLVLHGAADGETGVALARRLLPDLVLLDMQLPDIDGHEVFRRLRADPLTAALPCIALSANAMPEDIQRALAAGFADYWTKPLDLHAFMASLDTLFGGLKTTNMKQAMQ